MYRAKSCTSVFPAGKFLFVPSDTFAVSFSHKTHRKKNWRKRERIFRGRQSGVHWSCYVICYSLTSWTAEVTELWSVTLNGHVEWIEFGCVHKLYPLNRFVRTSRSSSCSWNRFDSLPVYRTSYNAVRSAITATAELLHRVPKNQAPKLWH